MSFKRRKGVIVILSADTLAAEGGWGGGGGATIKSRKLNCFLTWNKFTREDKAKSFGVLA